MQFTSYWAGDGNVVKGSLKDIDIYNSIVFDPNHRETIVGQNAFLFRPTQGDIIVDELNIKSSIPKIVNEKDVFTPINSNE